MKAAIFLERDGILNLARVERNHQVTPLTLDQFHVNQDAKPLLDELKSAGFLLIATTNQPGLSRGYQSRRELDLMHQILRRELPLDDLFICPHDETDHCPCRKPKAGLLLEAAFKHHIDLERSFVVSDKWQDAQAAHVAGCTSLLLKSQWNGPGHHDFVMNGLSELVQKVMQLSASGCLILNQF